MQNLLCFMKAIFKVLLYFACGLVNLCCMCIFMHVPLIMLTRLEYAGNYLVIQNHPVAIVIQRNNIKHEEVKQVEILLKIFL